jgi:uncharacterized protein YjiS (DUF1127 family)
MTCATCTDLDFAPVHRAPGLASRLVSALVRLRPAARLDLESLSVHQLRDLGLSDGRAAAPRNGWRD